MFQYLKCFNAAVYVDFSKRKGDREKSMLIFAPLHAS